MFPAQTDSRPSAQRPTVQRRHVGVCDAIRSEITSSNSSLWRCPTFGQFLSLVCMAVWWAKRDKTARRYRSLQFWICSHLFHRFVQSDPIRNSNLFLTENRSNHWCSLCGYCLLFSNRKPQPNVAAQCCNKATRPCLFSRCCAAHNSIVYCSVQLSTPCGRIHVRRRSGQSRLPG